MDETTNPRALPEAYDRFFLDGEPHPGISTISSGGDRKTKIEGQQALGDTGASTVIRGEELGEITYQIRVGYINPTTSSVAQLAELGTWLEGIRRGRNRRPKQVYDFVDLRLDHNAYSRVIVRNVSSIQQLAPGLWGVTIEFAEWKKRQAAGGPVKPKNTELDAANKADQSAGAYASNQWDRLKKAVQKGG